MMAEQQQRQLIERAKGSEIDLECPDCSSLITIFYGEKMKYICENCAQELSTFDMDRHDGDVCDYDHDNDNNNDNNISTGFNDLE